MYYILFICYHPRAGNANYARRQTTEEKGTGVGTEGE
jgi:hypothetical protein